MNDDDRGTGRTTKMLLEAHAKREDGRPILIVVHSAQMIDYCRMLCRQHNLPFRATDFTTVLSAAKRLRELSSDRVFIDHAINDLWPRGTNELYLELNLMRRTGR